MNDSFSNVRRFEGDVTPMIQVENLTKYYNDLCAVDQISLDIKKGEILGLLGPNGAGKTTTLRMLTGYLFPSSGTIRVLDYAIDENPLAIKKMMGYLPEFAPLYQGMLVYDYLNYVASIRGLKDDVRISRIRQMSRLCGLRRIMHMSIGELSRGLKQRVGLAHAMLHDPDILILDEPTSGLDPNQRLEIKDIIKQIGKEKTVILSTHILSEAEATCDRIVIINRGKIVADGQTEALKQSADQEYVIHLALRNADYLEVTRRLKEIAGVEEISADGEFEDEILNLRLNCKSKNDLREPLYQAVKQTEWVMLELYQETKTLEKIFRELTREN